MAFDLDRYKVQVRPVVLDDVDFELFASQPLDSAALRCIRYVHDVEYHTICYLRDLLMSPAHRDPDITGFLGLWVFEEYWHGEALGVLAQHREPSGGARVRSVRSRLGWRDRMRPWVMAFGGAIAKDDFMALHMT